METSVNYFISYIIYTSEFLRRQQLIIIIFVPSMIYKENIPERYPKTQELFCNDFIVYLQEKYCVSSNGDDE